MTILEFVDQNYDKETLIIITGQEVYDAFLAAGNVATWGYFRTQFNKMQYSARLSTNTNDIPNYPVERITVTTPQLVEIIEEQGRVIKNYLTGDVIPKAPDLIPTGTLFDEIVSDRITTEQDMKEYLEKYGEEMPEDKIEIGGFTRKCVDIVAGKAGSGKTYSRCVLAVLAKVFAKREYGKDIRVGFISGEMRESEWSKEITKCELLKEIEVDYMLNYVGQNNYESIFWEAVADYDIVIIDSFPAILGHIRMSPNEKRVEKTIVNDFIRKILTSVESNNNNVQLINQCNKDGNYKGGTDLPHMLSSLSFVQVEGNQRYLTYEKNRNNGNVNRKVYFSKAKNGIIEFNEEAYEATYKQTEDKQTSMEELMNALHSNQRSDDDTEEGLAERIAAVGDIGSTSTGFLAARNPEAETPEASIEEFSPESLTNPLIS
jgi:hypothetical protein